MEWEHKTNDYREYYRNLPDRSGITLSASHEINLGKHENHDWEVVTDVPSPHVGKIICRTCGGKWVTWLPKGFK